MIVVKCTHIVVSLSLQIEDRFDWACPLVPIKFLPNRLLSFHFNQVCFFISQWSRCLAFWKIKLFRQRRTCVTSLFLENFFHYASLCLLLIDMSVLLFSRKGCNLARRASDFVHDGVLVSCSIAWSGNRLYSLVTVGWTFKTRVSRMTRTWCTRIDVRCNHTICPRFVYRGGCLLLMHKLCCCL